MELVEASGTISDKDQRFYIKIETLRGKNPTEIHRALIDVCGESTVNHSTVFRWASRFRDGRESIDNNSRPRRPKITTDDRSVKLVADALEKDHCLTLVELSKATRISATSI